MPSSAILTMIPGTLSPLEAAIAQFRRDFEELVQAIIKRGTT